MKKMRLLISVLALIAVFILTVVMLSTSGLYYLDIPSALLVVLISFFILLPSYSLKEMVDAFKAAFEENRADASTLKKASAFFLSMRRAFYLSAGVGMLFGGISMLHVMSMDLDLFASLGTLLIVLFYAVLTDIFIITPFSAAIEKISEK